MAKAQPHHAIVPIHPPGHVNQQQAQLLQPGRPIPGLRLESYVAGCGRMPQVAASSDFAGWLVNDNYSFSPRCLIPECYQDLAALGM